MTGRWTELALGDLARVVGGGTPSTRVPRFWGGSIPWFTPGEITESGGVVTRSVRTITEEGLAASAAKMLAAGTILVTSRASIGNCAIAGVPVATNQGFTSLVPRDQRSSRFLYYWVQQNRHEFMSRAAGSTFLEISAKNVAAIRLMAPEDVREQEAIGVALGDADSLIGVLERQIAKKTSMRRGMLHALLTGETRLPSFTGPWAEVRLGDHVGYLRSVALSRAELDETSAVRCLHYGDIHTRAEPRLDATAEIMPRVTAVVAGRAGRLRPGDLVFADASEDAAGVGKSVEITAVPPEGVVPGLHTIAARFDKEVLADGFKAYLQFHPRFRQALLRLAAGTKVLATTRTYISSIVLALPPVPEQQAIAQVLIDADREMDVLRARLARARDVKQGMMQELLVGVRA